MRPRFFAFAFAGSLSLLCRAQAALGQDSDELPEELEEELTYGATAEVEAPPREPTKHRVEGEQLTTTPGTRGDALRAIEVLPGVGRTAFADGPPILRGSASYESLVLLDGAPVPILYHFGGLTSFFNSRLLEAVELSPGNYSARYGRATGGLVEAHVRDPKTDALHGAIELSLLDSSAMVEAPLGDSTAMAVAARRSNIDLVFSELVPEDTLEVVAAPVYYDYQAIVVHRFGRAHKLRLLGYGSSDRLELVFTNPNDEDPALRDELDGSISFHRLQARLESDISADVRQSIQISLGPQRLQQTLGALDAEFNALDVHARGDWEMFAAPELRVDAGLDVSYQYFSGHYLGPAPPQLEGDPAANDPLGTQRLVSAEASLHTLRPGAYVELAYQPVPQVLVLPGLRADYHSDANAFTLDPRLTSRVSVSSSTTLKTGVGLYSQPPLYYEVLPDIGNPDLDPYRAAQLSAGIEQALGDAVQVDIEGFYKRLMDRIVATRGGEPPRFINEGSGRIYGLEFLGTLRPSAGTRALLAYTLSRSERQDQGEPWRLFDRDQTHNLSVTANQQLGAGWVFGARFRLVSGDPITPVTGAVYDTGSDLYRPIYGAVNSERLPAFHQLDLRLEKRWAIGPGALTAYLEVLNVYNQQNPQSRRYSFDYSQSESVSGIPIFPNLGVRGEL